MQESIDGPQAETQPQRGDPVRMQGASHALQSSGRFKLWSAVDSSFESDLSASLLAGCQHVDERAEAHQRCPDFEPEMFCSYRFSLCCRSGSRVSGIAALMTATG